MTYSTCKHNLPFLSLHALHADSLGLFSYGSPFKKAVFTSIYSSSRSKFSIMANNILMDLCFITSENTSLKPTPSFLSEPPSNQLCFKSLRHHSFDSSLNLENPLTDDEPDTCRFLDQLLSMAIMKRFHLIIHGFQPSSLVSTPHNFLIASRFFIKNQVYEVAL